MRIVLVIMASLLALSVGWRYRAALSSVWVNEPPAREIVFDNGSVRDQAPPASSVAIASPSAGPRKCIRGDEVIYTNFACPRGYRERQVAGDRVSVVGSAPPRQAERPAAPERGQKTLRDALDLGEQGDLRERVMERAIAGK